MFTQLHLQMWYLNFIQDNKLFYKNIQLFNFCVLKIYLLCAIKIDTQFINSSDKMICIGRGMLCTYPVLVIDSVLIERWP